MDAATIIRAIPSGKAVLESTVAARLGLSRDATTPLLLNLKEHRLINYYYGVRGRIWFRDQNEGNRI